MQQIEPKSSELTEALLSASRAMVAIAAKSFSLVEDKITLSQYRVLIILATEGSQPPSALSIRLELKPYFITRICDRLIESRLITRKSSTLDRRKIELIITKKGKNLVSKVINARIATLNVIADKIAADKHKRVAEAFACFAYEASELFEERFHSEWLP